MNKSIGTGKAVKVWLKTDGRCAYCGCHLEPDDWHIEHMTPSSQGGTNRLSNLVPSCKLCNRFKYNRNVDQFRDHLLTDVADRIETWFLQRLGHFAHLIPEEHLENIALCVNAFSEVLHSCDLQFHFEQEAKEHPDE